MSRIKTLISALTLVLSALVIFLACGKQGDSNANKFPSGVGPFQNFDIGKLDEQKARKGEEIFKLKCTSCHKFEEKYVGPALAGVTNRRSSDWIMNIIYDPETMLEKDPIAQDLLITYIAKMVGQNLSQEETLMVYHYLKSEDMKKNGNH